MIMRSIPCQPAMIRPVACCKVDNVARSANTALAGVTIACKPGFENPKVSVAFIAARVKFFFCHREWLSFSFYSRKPCDFFVCTTC